MAHKNKKNRSPWKDRQRPNSQQKRNPSTANRHRKPQEEFSFEDADDRLYDYLRHHGYSSLPHPQRQKLTQFYLLLMKNQKVHNFTRLVRLRDIAIKHFVDCLMVDELVDLEFPLMDLGTGPGFPGIPLKIIHPQDRIILAEGVQSRVEFLKKVREELNLSELDIIGRYIREDFGYPVQSIITRAVEDVSNTLRKSLHCLPQFGKVYLMKGPNVDPELEDLDREAIFNDFELLHDHKYELPHTPHQRRLLVFQRTSQGDFG